MNEISELQEIIDNSDNIVFFGGAGVSTESGIPDFRSEKGVFKSLEKYGHSPEYLVSHTYYMNHPEEFFNYYKENLIFKDAMPNPAHLKLAELEKAGKLKAVITQNIDGLHQKAGSKNVLELHGSIHRNYCQRCGRFYAADYVKESKSIPRCSCGGIIKPNIVLYGEALNDELLCDAREYIAYADLLIVVGTSLTVYPAARLIRNFKGTITTFNNYVYIFCSYSCDIRISFRII